MSDTPLDLAALGEAISRRREHLGWSTHRLSEKTGVGDAYLRRVENGKVARIGVDVVVRIAHALGANSDDLLSDAGLPTSSRLSGQVSEIYDQLGLIERRAWLGVGRVLKQLRADYAALQREDAEPRLRQIADSHADYDAQQPLDTVTDAEEDYRVPGEYHAAGQDPPTQAPTEEEEEQD